jgi:lipopolysaccharide/colanic/teichoic acid biosynthesis glycosyltransferase
MELHLPSSADGSFPVVPPASPRRRSLSVPRTSAMTIELADVAPGRAVHPDIVPREQSEKLSRAMNVAIAGTALVLSAPVLLAAAIAVKITSPGPIFYAQTRVGEDRRWRYRGQASSYDRRAQDLGGRAFLIYKLRTMRVNAEARTGAVWATQGDPRITPIGRFLRKCRVDELPQLINVIKGDMNIVGPRPERPGIFRTLREDVAGYEMRQRAKPGITGWAQINHNYDMCLDDVRTKVRYDLEYLQRRGVMEDLRIMARTIPVMLFRKGAL